jgi:hypothetical protein
VRGSPGRAAACCRGCRRVRCVGPATRRCESLAAPLVLLRAEARYVCFWSIMGLSYRSDLTYK